MQIRTLLSIVALTVSTTAIIFILAPKSQVATADEAAPDETTSEGEQPVEAVSESSVEQVPAPEGISIGDRVFVPHVLGINGNKDTVPCLMLPGAILTVTAFTPGDPESQVNVEYRRMPSERPSDAMYADGVMAQECKDKQAHRFNAGYFRKQRDDEPEFPSRCPQTRPVVPQKSVEEEEAP